MQIRSFVISLSRAVLALCFIGIASGARAQGRPMVPSARGFSVGGQVTLASREAIEVPVAGVTVKAEGASRAGGGATLAYGVTEWLTVFMRGDGAETDEDHVLTHGDIGAQFFYPTGTDVRPHLDLAVTGRRAEFDAGGRTIDLRGAGWSFGGGVQYFFTPSLALDAALLHSVGRLAQFRDGAEAEDLPDLDLSSTRVSFLVRWYPGKH